jgi:hypothetical protein
MNFIWTELLSKLQSLEISVIAYFVSASKILLLLALCPDAFSNKSNHVNQKSVLASSHYRPPQQLSHYHVG